MILAWSSESPDEAIMARKLLISLVGSLSLLNWKFHAAINIRTGCGNCMFFMYDEVSKQHTPFKYFSSVKQFHTQFLVVGLKNLLIHLSYLLT